MRVQILLDTKQHHLVTSSSQRVWKGLDLFLLTSQILMQNILNIDCTNSVRPTRVKAFTKLEHNLRYDEFINRKLIRHKIRTVFMNDL